MPIAQLHRTSERPVDARAVTRAMALGARHEVSPAGLHVSGVDVLYRSSRRAPPP